MTIHVGLSYQELINSFVPCVDFLGPLFVCVDVCLFSVLWLYVPLKDGATQSCNYEYMEVQTQSLPSSDSL